MVANDLLSVASWNIEGFTEEKLVTIQHYMEEQNIHIVSLQETHRSGSEFYVTISGYLVIFSGNDGGSKENAGVGFIVSPRVRRSVVAFNQATSRWANLKMRVPGGKVCIVSAYSPHSGYSYNERQHFYTELGNFVDKLSSNGPKLVYGDFNAKLFRQLPTETDVIGLYVHPSANSEMSPELNRYLLHEFCVARSMVISNTFFNEPPERRVTCYSIGSQAMEPINGNSHSQIDFLLVPKDFMYNVEAVFSQREVSLASHHFPLITRLQISVPKLHKVHGPGLPLRSALRDPEMANRFAVLFDQVLEDKLGEPVTSQDVNLLNAQILDAFHDVSDRILPTSTFRPRRAWTSPRSLALITERHAARQCGDRSREAQLNKQVKRSIQNDKSIWLDSLLASGDWSQIRKLRRPSSTKQGRLNDASGDLVDTDRRAETLAAYLESVQWAVRPVTVALDRPPLNAELPLADLPVSEGEVVKAAQALKWNKAYGPDGLPGEFWKAVLTKGSPSARWMVELCQACWDGETVPDDWHLARVATLFKKGDPSECGNYRPICLVSVGYKIFATILLRRLKAAGAESKVWRTQFGFRSGYGTADALFVVRRLLEDTWAAKDGRMVFAALDWARAFDSISPTALHRALLRFGVPEKFANVVGAIYRDRKFFVRDAGADSAKHQQHFGISQGCPLSPFLFAILMTVLLHDAKVLFHERGLGPFADSMPVNELVYADDTLVFDFDPAVAEGYILCIEVVAGEYGLTFNFSKLEALNVRTSATIRNSAGGVIKAKNVIRYLGSNLSSDGRISSELGTRIGLATQEFAKLRRIWSHCSITKARKSRIFSACVDSGLLYSLHTGVLNTAERRRLDGFQARCLRKIFGILPAFHSRVSNATVLQRSGCKSCSTTLAERQDKYLQTMRERPLNDPCRQMIFEFDGRYRRFTGPRKVGRPRTTWLDQALARVGHS